MKKILLILCTIALLFPQMLFAAQTNSMPSEMELLYKINGATNAQINEMNLNYSKGVLPESIQGTADPIETNTVVDKYGNYSTTYTYSDGSISVFQVTGGDCGSNGYSSWCTGAKVSLDNGLYKAHFYADYGMSSAGYDISKVYNESVVITDPNYIIIPGSIDLVINVGESTTKAYATLYWTSSFSGIESYLRLYVDGSGAYSKFKADYMTGESPA